MKVVRRLRYTRALRSRKGLWLIRLDKMDKKDKDYDGDDKHSVTNDNPAQERADIEEERADIEEVRALKKTQATTKSIGHLCSKKLTWLAVK